MSLSVEILLQNYYTFYRELIIMEKKNFSGLKRAVSIALMGAICLTASAAVTTSSKTVTVTDGEKTVTINTISSDTESILEKTGVKLGEDDKIVCTENSESSVNISVMRAFSVDVVDGKTRQTLTFNEGTVADAIKAAGITLSKSDSVSLSQNTALEPDMEITIARFFTVNINLRGEKLTREVPAGTVTDALAYLDIKLEESDSLNINKDIEVSENMNIIITSITYNETSKTEEVAYNTVYKDTDDMYRGESSVETQGVNGERTIVTREKYVNGKLEASKEIKNEITKQPVDEVILNGTKEYVSQVYTYSGTVSANETSNILTDVNGNQVHYTRVLTGSGTAYYAPAGALTSTGRLARYGVVAVDPDIIPYGSILYIVSNDGQVVYGYAVAGDTGGALWAGTAIVDLYYNTYDECCQFGRRDVTIYVLDGVSEDITY